MTDTNSGIKVGQSIIDEFKKNGMAASLKKFRAGEGSDEFNEAIKRYYPSASKQGPAPKTENLDTPLTEATKLATSKVKEVKGIATKAADSAKDAAAKVAAAAQRKTGVKPKQDQGLGASRNGGEFALRLGRNLGNFLSKRVGASGKTPTQHSFHGNKDQMHTNAAKRRAAKAQNTTGTVVDSTASNGKPS